MPGCAMMDRMTSNGEKAVLWAPRILGILVALFLGLFALDAFDGMRSVVEALPGFAIHASPAVALLLIVAVSWRWEWVGGVACTALALLYAAVTLPRLDWILIVAGPLLMVGVLFLVSWRHRKLHARA